jgi:hypothetical protein
MVTEHKEIIGMQIVQAYVDEGGNVELLTQEPKVVPDSANGFFQWSVYGRHEVGDVTWLADFEHREHAFGFGNMLAATLSVVVETYPWMTSEDRTVTL